MLAEAFARVSKVSEDLLEEKGVQLRMNDGDWIFWRHLRRTMRILEDQDVDSWLVIVMK